MGILSFLNTLDHRKRPSDDSPLQNIPSPTIPPPPDQTRPGQFSKPQAPKKRPGTLEDVGLGILSEGRERGWGPRPLMDPSLGIRRTGGGSQISASSTGLPLTGREPLSASSKIRPRSISSVGNGGNPPLLYAKPWYAPGVQPPTIQQTPSTPTTSMPNVRRDEGIKMPEPWIPQKIPSRISQPRPMPSSFTTSTFNNRLPPPVSLKPKPYHQRTHSSPPAPPKFTHTSSSSSLSSTNSSLLHPARASLDQASSVSDSALTPKRKRPSKTLATPLVSPTSLSLKGGKEGVQCSGTTSSGKRCTRMIQSTSSGAKQADLDALDEVLKLARLDLNDDEGDAGVKRFCFQHSKQVLGEKGVFVNGKWVEFQDWIDEALPEETRLMLRLEIGKDLSPKETHGYIYVYELLPNNSQLRSSSTMTTYIKLGRSLHPVARLSQWKQQCPSRNLVLRDFYPLATPNGGTRITGAQQMSAKGGRNHKRWERLCLIEMNGRAKQVKGKCKDCDREHQELFMTESGAYEVWIKEMVLKWGKFCEDVL